MGEAVKSAGSSSDPLVGTELGGYRIEALLGAGAVGKVYRARHIVLDRPVALKVLRPAMAASNEALTRFRREAKAAATIKHPHLIEVFDFGEVGGTYYYAMELIEGRSLGRYLERGEKFSERECVEVGRQALSALDAAHKAGIVHRDVEPGNLLLGPKGRIKLGDLGLAHFDAAGADAALTQPGISMGTPGYMSPEQAQGRPDVDYRSDFYGLGATLFHLAAGRPPFEGRSLFEIIASHLNAPVPSAHDVNPAISQRFSDLIQRLMAKKPDERPQTHTEIYDELDRCRKPESESGAAETRIPFSEAATIEKQRQVDSWVVVAGAAAVLVALAFGILALRNVMRDSSPSRVLGEPERQEMREPESPGAAEPGGGRRSEEPSIAPKRTPRSKIPAEPPSSAAPPKVLAPPAEPPPAPSEKPMPVEPPPPAPAPAQAVAPPTIVDPDKRDAEAVLASLREILDMERSQRAERVARYLQDLADIEKRVSGRGDLDGALSVKQEQRDWADGSGGETGGANDPRAPSELRSLRQFVDRDLQIISGRREVRWMEEKHRAITALRVIELRLTRAARLDAALAVRGAVAAIEKGEVPETPLAGFGGASSPASSPVASAAPTEIANPMAPVGNPKGVTKDHPFVNSLGMRFVPVKGTRVLFSVWETRVSDFSQFVREKLYTGGGDAPFDQGPDHPVVMVSWNDAEAFCKWLSEKEGLEYRLPTGQEWSMAVGKGRYPWGDEYPPPRESENLAGEEAKTGRGDPSGVISGWRDKHPRTAPVGSYRRNRFGLYDLGGNAWEWCEDVYTEGANGRDFAGENARRLGRGGHWAAGSVSASVTSARQDGKEPDQRDGSSGFRCVIVLSP